MNPLQHLTVIGPIWSACRKGPSRFGEVSSNQGMSPVELSGGAKGLIHSTKEHAEHNTEGLVESGQRIVHNIGMIGNSRRDPGVGQLKE
jgi:hypothetical protein